MAGACELGGRPTRHCEPTGHECTPDDRLREAIQHRVTKRRNGLLRGGVIIGPAEGGTRWLLAMTSKTKTGGNTMSKDIDELTMLNRDYVNSVQNSDVKRFDEILADEFYCSNPDRSLVDRAGFPKQTAVPVTIKN